MAEEEGESDSDSEHGGRLGLHWAGADQEEESVMVEEDLLHLELGSGVGAGSLLVSEPHESCDGRLETDSDG